MSVLVGIFFILPLIGVGILKWAVLPPEKLTPLVVEKTNEFIEAHLECERVELTYFETYPYLGVKLTNGRLISHLAEDSIGYQEDLMIPSDSLLSFKKAIVVFNPTDYLFSGKVTIPRVIMDSIRFYGYVNEEGKANWEITKVTGESDGLTVPKILCVLEQEDGTIFAGTDGNGIAVIKNGKVEDVYNKEDGLSSEVILRMVKNEDGGVFIVTSNGICYMDTEGKIRSLDKFPYYNNYGIVEGIDHTLFISGSAGIYVVDKEDLLSGKELEYKLLNSDAGLNRALTPNAWNYVDENMNFYFSTDTGVICMDLKNYEVSVRSYRMQMKSVKIDDVSHFVRRGEVIYLERGAEKLEIFPEIINYSVNIPYVSVYLEGYDSEPQVVSQSEMSSVIYTNLPVGTYKFHIAVLDHKGQNPVVESVYTIEKKAEIYDHWWFVVYIVAVFTLAVAYLTWMIFHTQVQRVINLQKKEIELVKKQLEMGNETVLTIAKTVDAKDVRTSQHSERVAEYSVLIAKELGFDEKSCEDLKKAALLHDIGKIGIPDRILNKPGKLTDEEYGIMKSHVTKGAEILKSFTIVDHVEEGALYHHERYDGKGYVHGLKGEEIPINARIIGIADTFDAMTANRVYRKQLDMAYVIQELKNGRGTQFDPGLVDVMLGLIDNGKIDICSLYKEHTHTDHSREKEEE